MRTRRTEKLLSAWADWSSISYRKAFVIIIVITALVSLGYIKLHMEMTFYSLMPKDTASVQDFQVITEEFPFASQIVVVVGTDREADTAQVKQTIDALQKEFSGPQYEQSIESVYGKIDRTFLQDHGLMLMEREDLTRFSDGYQDYNLVPLLRSINDDFEREYTGDADALEDEQLEAVSRFQSLEVLLSLIDQAARGGETDEQQVLMTIEDHLLGESYILSEDGHMGLMFILPTFTINDFLEYGHILEIEENVREIAAAHGTTAGLTGMIVVGKDEMVTSEQGLGLSMIIAFTLIIMLMILVFRMNSAPVLTGLPLIIGIIWTVGASGLVVGRLNIITAMYMVALMGLGIDYAIHIFSTYIQSRDEGLSWHDGIIFAYTTSGRGIITGGLTTAAAFAALAFAESDILRELGIVAGIGILCEMAAMLLMIPPLLGRRHQRLEKKGRIDPIHRKSLRLRSTMTGRIGILVQRHPGKILAVSLSFGVILSLFAPGVRIEDNLMEMEAKGLESIELQDLLVEEFGMAPDGLFILSSDLQELEGLEEELSELQTVASVDSIHSYLPSEERQLIRRGLITEYAERIAQRPPSDPAIDMQGLLDEVFRLEMNLVELGDMAYLGKMERISPVLNRITGIDDEGSKYRRTVFDDLAASLLSDAASPQLQLLQSQVDRSMACLLTDMADPQLITQEMLPDMFRDSFVSRDGSRYIMTINAKENPWVGEHREAFTTQVGSVTGRATGMILVADQLTYMAANDGIRSALLALLIVGLILVADFRNIRLALLTFLPLLLSFGTLFGIMAITGIRFDFINIIAIPLLIGIGIDDAVHIDHRYRKEGPGSMDRVIARTGTAVLLTSITTIIGFASFIPSVMRAMRSTGIVLSLAMALAFFYSIFLHPAVLILVHERFGVSFASWGDKEEGS